MPTSQKHVRGSGEEGKGNIYFKKLAYTVVEVGRSEIYKADQRARNSSRISMLQA